LGIMDDIKGLFSESTIMDFGYSIASGLTSGAVGALLQRHTNSKYAAWLGYILGGAGMAYVADRFLAHPELKNYAYFGALFPPLWEIVTDKISPDTIAGKLSAGLGMPWRSAVTTTYSAPVVVSAPVTPSTPTSTVVDEEYLY